MKTSILNYDCVLLTSLLCIVLSVSLRASHFESEEPGTPIHLAFPQSVVNDVNTIYIPFSFVGQLIAVQARVDSLEGNFIVDTGAERLVLNSHYFSGISGRGNIAAAGNTGFISDVQWEIVDSLQISQLVIPNLLAHLVDLHHIELKKNARVLGILGYKVFEEFELFLDYPNRILVLSRVHKDGSRKDRDGFREIPNDSMSFTLRKHLINVQATVNSVKLRMILDSGAELNLLDRRVNRKVLDQFSILKRISLSGAGRREVEVLAGVLKEVKCGNQLTASMNTLLTSMDEINDAFGTSAHGVLGFEFLSPRRTLINYQKQKLYFFAPLRP